jgi:hypothetical protein
LLERERNAVHVATVARGSFPDYCRRGTDHDRRRCASRRDPDACRCADGRQEALVGEQPTHLHAVIGEPVLRRTIGGPEVMARQLRHLTKTAKLPNVDIQVVPFERTGTRAWKERSSFVAATTAPAWSTWRRGPAGLFLHEPNGITPHEQAFERALEVALEPQESRALIEQHAERMEKVP